MEITRDSVMEEGIFNRLRDNMFAEERTGIHLSDLLYPRLRYWREIRPLPPSDDEIMYWLTGKGHENVFVRVGEFKPGVPTEWQGIIYTNDIYEGHPVEIKTRRGWVAEPGQEADRYGNYLNQLRGYCAVTHNTNGTLIVWALTQGGNDNSKRTKPIMQVYRVVFTPAELADERLRLIKLRDKLRFALSTISELAGIKTFAKEAHKPLPPCPDWMCGTSRRNPPECSCGAKFATVAGHTKHIKGKVGGEHTLIESWTVEPKCAYLPDCRGDEEKWKGAIQAGVSADAENPSEA